MLIGHDPTTGNYGQGHAFYVNPAAGATAANWIIVGGYIEWNNCRETELVYLKNFSNSRIDGMYIQSGNSPTPTRNIYVANPCINLQLLLRAFN
ncbi:MAG: hypothetical protein FJ135_00275 [Deltaproteobacteria bacterium]|nr:hypothetical protein [Deltaproteobacteria bacterium]